MEKVIIESFTLDHTKVIAPYVRLIGEEQGEHGDIVSNFDVRLAQPNKEEIPTGGMHTLEHLLALYLRPRIKGYLDCSPFGCRTGFHLLCWATMIPGTWQKPSRSVGTYCNDKMGRRAGNKGKGMRQL